MKKVEFVETCCLGCAIRIVAFKNKKDSRDSSIYLTLLSDHMHVWVNSWRGRLKLAWWALKGKEVGDIELGWLDDIEEFKEKFDEVYKWIKDTK